MWLQEQVHIFENILFNLKFLGTEREFNTLSLYTCLALRFVSMGHCQRQDSESGGLQFAPLWRVIYIYISCVLVMLQIPRNLPFVKNKHHIWSPCLHWRPLQSCQLGAWTQNPSHVQAMLVSWRYQQCSENCCCLIFFQSFIPEPWTGHSLPNGSLLCSAKGKTQLPFPKEWVSLTRNLSLQLSVSPENENLEQDAGKPYSLYHHNSIGPVTWDANKMNISGIFKSTSSYASGKWRGVCLTLKKPHFVTHFVLLYKNSFCSSFLVSQAVSRLRNAPLLQHWLFSHLLFFKHTYR